MGSSWALVCSTALVLVLLSSSTGDVQQQINPEDMLQRSVDISEPFGGSIPIMSPRFSPRGFGPIPFGERYPVKFPLGQPTSKNLQAICLYGNRRPRYPKSYFPDSGFGSQSRMGRAVNKAESWFSTCCEGNQTWGMETTLCCATRAWEKSIESFCEEEFRVKTRHYHCCQERGAKRLNCFHNNAPNPNYEPTEEVTMLPPSSTSNFKFDPSTCQREMEPPSSQKTDINFPPGQPTEDTIKSLCHNQILRPLYSVKCLPGVGYKWLARQAKTINRMEKGFKQCCKKKNMLTCAEQKWREELDRFCLAKKGGQVDFSCCLHDGTNDRYSCFQQIAPDPHYNMTSTAEELSLNNICDTHKTIGKMFPKLTFKKFVDQCCPLPEEEKATCLVQKLEEMSKTICSSREVSPHVRRCCRGTGQKNSQCISKILMNAVTKATRVSHQKKKKCPIS